MTNRKTNWPPYGSVYKRILAYAKRGPFCVTELTKLDPPVTSMLAALNCRHLYETGRLVLIRKADAGMGRYGRKARYKHIKGEAKVREARTSL